MDGKGTPVDEETMEATYAVPTIVVNRFVISTTADNFRIVFGESRGGGPRASWRVGLSMTPLEAHELKEILESLLQPFQPQIDAVLSQTNAAKEARDGEAGNV